MEVFRATDIPLVSKPLEQRIKVIEWLVKQPATPSSADPNRAGKGTGLTKVKAFAASKGSFNTKSATPTASTNADPSPGKPAGKPERMSLPNPSPVERFEEQPAYPDEIACSDDSPPINQSTSPNPAKLTVIQTPREPTHTRGPAPLAQIIATRVPSALQEGSLTTVGEKNQKFSDVSALQQPLRQMRPSESNSGPILSSCGTGQITDHPPASPDPQRIWRSSSGFRRRSPSREMGSSSHRRAGSGNRRRRDSYRREPSPPRRRAIPDSKSTDSRRFTTPKRHRTPSPPLRCRSPLLDRNIYLPPRSRSPAPTRTPPHLRRKVESDENRNYARVEVKRARSPAPGRSISVERQQAKNVKHEQEPRTKKRRLDKVERKKVQGEANILVGLPVTQEDRVKLEVKEEDDKSKVKLEFKEEDAVRVKLEFKTEDIGTMVKFEKKEEMDVEDGETRLKFMTDHERFVHQYFQSLE